MKTLGISGGIGAGKSAILKYIEENYNVDLIYADNLANKIMTEDSEVAREIKSKFCDIEFYNKEGEINKNIVSEYVFSREDELKKLNKIVHPRVKKYIINRMENAGEPGILLVESALLIEEEYYRLFDIIYIHADEEIRIKRLMENRGYSREKAISIIKRQLSPDRMREHCKYEIENNGDLKAAYADADRIIKLFLKET